MANAQTRRPDRFTGLPSGVVVGPLGRRFVASLVDGIVPTVVTLVAFGLPGLGDSPSSGAATVGAVLLGLWGLVVWWMLAVRAAGPGMWLLKLQLVGFTDGRPIGWGRVLLRAVVLALLTVTGLGLLLMLVFLVRHPRHQGWHDLASNAVVIRARALAPRTRPTRPTIARPAAASPAASPAKTATEALAPVEAVPVQAASPVETAPVEVAPAPASTPRPWVAVLDDGRELVVAGLVLLGRNPQPRPGEEGAELIKLSDESRTVSKTHLALDVDARGLFVVDRDSTNGSTLTTPTGEAFRCVPGQPTYLDEGSVVTVGDHRLTVRVDAVDRDGEGSRSR
ncbi:RDD family protein [uncultured Friedmanniella sp.]|uniref:RDD family protein n=1 Tax=uncultured Friedmanniella sp. TaxID=335381 RepID=UPI0035CB62D9